MTTVGVPEPDKHSMVSKFVEVDDLATHYFEGGSGPTLVLAHSGEYGSCAELSWEYNFAGLAASFRVIAPDWLGFGQTAKVYDFENGLQRRIRHMARFLETIGVQSAHFVGNSMGAAFLLRDAASEQPQLPCRTITAISGGGDVPDNEWRRALVDYDGTTAGMQQILKALFNGDAWSSDPDYLRRRHEESMRPGAWECTAAARLISPAKPPRSDIGGQDPTPYEKIGVPVLLITGAADRLKPENYGRQLRDRIPSCELLEVEGGAHCPHIETPGLVNSAIASFLTRIEAGA